MKTSMSWAELCPSPPKFMYWRYSPIPQNETAFEDRAFKDVRKWKRDCTGSPGPIRQMFLKEKETWTQRVTKNVFTQRTGCVRTQREGSRLRATERDLGKTTKYPAGPPALPSSHPLYIQESQRETISPFSPWPVIICKVLEMPEF